MWSIIESGEEIMAKHHNEVVHGLAKKLYEMAEGTGKKVVPFNNLPDGDRNEWKYRAEAAIKIVSGVPYSGPYSNLSSSERKAARDFLGY